MIDNVTKKRKNTYDQVLELEPNRKKWQKRLRGM